MPPMPDLMDSMEGSPPGRPRRGQAPTRHESLMLGKSSQGLWPSLMDAGKSVICFSIIFAQQLWGTAGHLLIQHR